MGSLELCMSSFLKVNMEIFGLELIWLHKEGEDAFPRVRKEKLWHFGFVGQYYLHILFWVICAVIFLLHFSLILWWQLAVLILLLNVSVQHIGE